MNKLLHTTISFLIKGITHRIRFPLTWSHLGEIFDFDSGMRSRMVKNRGYQLSAEYTWLQL